MVITRKLIRILRIATLLLFILSLLNCSRLGFAEQDSAQAALIQLAPAARYQTITGWEATSYAGQDDSAFPLYKDALFALAIRASDKIVCHHAPFSISAYHTHGLCL